ncbi:DNA integrity scanning protein DisA [bacterium BMS3Abin07]|nr:DNA integrity scanning protein DisA [bacterium BMS3Abin07]GBE32348.1 DNA integrity scanning protein DisA [bacterium BMS3Bbin05]HDL20779.1 TIGR00159 family protein [Nitrospirota bacterium]HDO21709.1 TIGR00159 family protein [Nitrospirota bacterium]HDZ87654.1 TIGR00159 family protein [Nitrospirota bacterium]
MTEILRHLRWQDAFDVIIVAVVIYRLLILIKGTRAVQMLVGLGVLLLASIISRYLRFYTLDWLLQGFWEYIVIALIVLFAPEIRKALAKMGQASFLPAFARAEELKSHDEIVKAVVSLASRKIGALIVIERETTLQDFIEIGVPLDAKVSRELLLSIFHPSSPIHDGAVIIRGNRILAAGCFLPITLSARLGKEFGTRHRAAIGITEESDAVAIIVSEEAGKISLAMTERFETPLDMGTLRDMMTELFAERKK